MSYYKFSKNDVFFNQIEAYPQCEFLIYSGSMIYNGKSARAGEHATNIKHVPSGHISLYEINVDRTGSSLTYPFVTKEGSLTSFKTTSTSNFNSDFAYGDVISGSYPLSASISKERYSLGQSRPYVVALQNTLNYYRKLSPHYAYSSSAGAGDKSVQELGLLSIPSIFYGSSIKKGSVNLRFFVTGALQGELQDKNKNGELIEVSGSNAGKVAGVVLYNEGFIVLTGSWDLSSGQHTEAYHGDTVPPSWIYFGQSISGSITAPSSSFQLQFKGTQYVPTITMFAHSNKGQHNHSNNPTYIVSGSQTALTSSTKYVEAHDREIKNVASSSYVNHSASFEKQTYISKVGIFDKDKNLIAVAKMATPVRKRENDDFTFKLKLDL
tara:strand:- start:2409 stop:3551 length:1143 start_codon:yes stop_codon:yes gene_type:complete